MCTKCGRVDSHFYLPFGGCIFFSYNNSMLKTALDFSSSSLKDISVHTGGQIKTSVMWREHFCKAIWRVREVLG